MNTPREDSSSNNERYQSDHFSEHPDPLFTADQYRLVCQISALSTFFEWSDVRQTGPAATSELEEELGNLEIPPFFIKPRPIKLKHVDLAFLDPNASYSTDRRDPFAKFFDWQKERALRDDLDNDSIQPLSNIAGQIFLDLSRDPIPQVATAAIVALLKSLGINHLEIDPKELLEIDNAQIGSYDMEFITPPFLGEILSDSIEYIKLRQIPATFLRPAFEFLLKSSLSSFHPWCRIIARTAFKLTGPEPTLKITPFTQPGGHFTLIHGTFARKSHWIKDGSDFFSFIRSNISNHSTSIPQAHFSWSGAYSHNKRTIAAKNLQKWHEQLRHQSTVGGYFATYIAHSYGADVAARMLGLNDPSGHNANSKLVALSAPVTKHLVSLGSRLTDIRLSFDFVLALDGAVQRVTAYPQVNRKKLQSIILPTFPRNAEPLYHSSTHEPQVWDTYSLIARSNL